MKRATNWIAGLLLWMLPAVLAAQPVPRGLDDETVETLRDLVDGLFAGVRAEDDAAIDEVVCMDEWLTARIARETALGLLVEELSPSELEERRSEVRARATAFTNRLLSQVDEVEWLDFSRIDLSVEEPGERLISDDGREVAITGHGVLGIKMLTHPRLSDVEVSRVGDRWCLNPYSMQ